MKGLVLRASVLSCIILAEPLAANSVLDDLFPYGGADFERTYMKGGHVWRKHVPAVYSGGNFFVGVRLCDVVAAELGYDFTNKHHKHTELLKTRVRMDSWHIDLNAFLPHEFLELCMGMNVFGTIGLASMKTSIGARVRRAETELIQIDPVQADRKRILRMGAGVEYMFENCIGIRGIIRWKNTERFRIRANIVNQESGFSAKPCEDAVTVSVGVFTYF